MAKAAKKPKAKKPKVKQEEVVEAPPAAAPIAERYTAVAFASLGMYPPDFATRWSHPIDTTKLPEPPEPSNNYAGVEDPLLNIVQEEWDAHWRQLLADGGNDLEPAAERALDEREVTLQEHLASGKFDGLTDMEAHAAIQALLDSPTPGPTARLAAAAAAATAALDRREGYDKLIRMITEPNHPWTDNHLKVAADMLDRGVTRFTR